MTVDARAGEDEVKELGWETLCATAKALVEMHWVEQMSYHLVPSGTGIAEFEAALWLQ